MKNLRIFLPLLLLVLIIGIYLNHSSMLLKECNSTVYYGKIENENTIFYDTSYTPKFNLLQSYYVEIIEKNDNFYLVKYKDLTGYVKSKDITLSEKPTQPYLNDIEFTTTQNTFLSKTPSLSGKFLELDNNSSLNFIGNFIGENISPYENNLWHYVYYEHNGETLYGYVYSPYTSGVGGIIKNNEVTGNLISSFDELKSIPENISYFIVFLLFIPTFYILFILLSPNKNINN